MIDTEGIGGRRDLDGKNWGLRFLKRVPLTGERRADINCTDPADYPRLAEMVEAWACRLMHDEGAYFDKPTMASRWYDEEYTPVLEMIDEAGVRGPDETGADAYLRVAERALPADPRARVEPRRDADDRPEERNRRRTAASVAEPAGSCELEPQPHRAVGRQPP